MGFDDLGFGDLRFGKMGLNLLITYLRICNKIHLVIVKVSTVSFLSHSHIMAAIHSCSTWLSS